MFFQLPAKRFVKQKIQEVTNGLKDREQVFQQKCVIFERFSTSSDLKR